jgi:hypothetical protein
MRSTKTVQNRTALCFIIGKTLDVKRMLLAILLLLLFNTAVPAKVRLQVQRFGGKSNPHGTETVTAIMAVRG